MLSRIEQLAQRISSTRELFCKGMMQVNDQMLNAIDNDRILVNTKRGSAEKKTAEKCGEEVKWS